MKYFNKTFFPKKKRMITSQQKGRPENSKHIATEDGKCCVSWGDKWSGQTGECKNTWKKGEYYYTRNCRCKGSHDWALDYIDRSETSEDENNTPLEEQDKYCLKHVYADQCIHCNRHFCEYCEYGDCFLFVNPLCTDIVTLHFFPIC